MKRIILLFVTFNIFFSLDMCCQSWRSATDPVQYQPGLIGELAVDIIESYDTVSCKYKIRGSEMIFSGFKLFYKKKGFYIDDNNTLNVFFDERKKLIKNVSSYQY